MAATINLNNINVWVFYINWSSPCLSSSPSSRKLPHRREPRRSLLPRSLNLRRLIRKLIKKQRKYKTKMMMMRMPMMMKMMSLNPKKLPQRKLRKLLPKRQKKLLLPKKKLLKERKENDHFEQSIIFLINS